MITIIHTGQTGVERGADRAARAVGLPVRGYCQRDARDEFGALPANIACDLTPVDSRGVRLVWPPTLRLADVLVIAVPDARMVKANPGMGSLQTLARACDVPQIVVDPRTDLDELARDLRRRELDRGMLAVMVSGPRATRWHHGERFGWQLVTSLASIDESIARRVLVVDDDADQAHLLCGLVSLLGHECELAMSASEALERTQTLRPDVALLDIELPDMSGYELARRLRETQTQPLYLAAVTGWDLARDPTKALNAGFDQHFIKPIGAQLLQAVFDGARERLRAV